MARPTRASPSDRKEIWFPVRQIDLLDALRETAALGKPSFTSLVVQAVEEFLARELARPGVQGAVDKHLKASPRVVNLRDVSSPTSDS